VERASASASAVSPGSPLPPGVRPARQGGGPGPQLLELQGRVASKTDPRVGWAAGLRSSRRPLRNRAPSCVERAAAFSSSSSSGRPHQAGGSSAAAGGVRRDRPVHPRAHATRNLRLRPTNAAPRRAAARLEWNRQARAVGLQPEPQAEARPAAKIKDRPRACQSGPVQPSRRGRRRRSAAPGSRAALHCGSRFQP